MINLLSNNLLIYLILGILLFIVVLLLIVPNTIENFSNGTCLDELKTNKDMVNTINTEETELINKFSSLLKSKKIKDEFKETSSERMNRLINKTCVGHKKPNWNKITKILAENDLGRCKDENIIITDYITKCRDKTLEIIKNEIKFLEKNLDKKFIENYNAVVMEYNKSINDLKRFRKTLQESYSKLEKEGNDKYINMYNNEKKTILDKHDTTLDKLDNYYNNIGFRSNDELKSIYNIKTDEKFDYNEKKIKNLIVTCNNHHNIYIILDNYINGTLIIKLNNSKKNNKETSDIKIINKGKQYDDNKRDHVYKESEKKSKAVLNNLKKSISKEINNQPQIKKNENIILKPNNEVIRDKTVYNQLGYSYMPPESWIIGDTSLRCKGSKKNTFIENGTTGFPYNAHKYIKKS